jgi:hypothetical protein
MRNLLNELRARKEENLYAGDLRISITSDISISGGARTERAKTLSDDVRRRHIRENREFYEKMYRELRDDSIIKGGVLHLAACAEDETAADGDPNSVFTRELLKVLRRTTPPVNYTDLRAEVDALLVAQTPQLISSGAINPAFMNATPFDI